nr:hypothetical protein [Pantoea agglomerans]
MQQHAHRFVTLRYLLDHLRQQWSCACRHRAADVTARQPGKQPADGLCRNLQVRSGTDEALPFSPTRRPFAMLLSNWLPMLPTVLIPTLWCSVL